MRVVTLGLALAALAAVPLSAQAPTEKPRPATPSVDDAGILAMLERANTQEIELGELAARTGQSTEVRDLGKKLAEDHTKARQKARDLAKKIGVTPGTPMHQMEDMKDPKDSTRMGDTTMSRYPADTTGKMKNPRESHETTLSRLRGLKGNEFDVAFVSKTIEIHQRMLDDVSNKLLPAAKNAELRQFLTELKPDLQAHLDQARALEKKLALGN